MHADARFWAFFHDLLVWTEATAPDFVVTKPLLPKVP